MAIATLTSYLDNLRRPVILSFYKNSAVTSNGVLGSAFTAAQLGGSVPSTAATCNSSTVGAINIASSVATNSLDMYISGATSNSASSVGACIMVVDRLSHMGGLSGTSTGAITTNLPTAALPRYTSGVGVMAAVEIYTAIGTTATAARISYTNQAGTSGRISKDIVFGGSLNNTATRLLPFCLQDGDTGVRSVESITVDATTGTAGNYGITLFKPIAYLPLMYVGSAPYNFNYNPLIGGAGQFENITSDACLQLNVVGTNAFVFGGTISAMTV